MTALPGGGRGVGLSLALFVLMLAASSDASAAALGSLATSVGLIAALTAMVFVKGWSAQGGASSLTTAGALIALGAGGLLLWRLLRGATVLPTGWRPDGRAARGPDAARASRRGAEAPAVRPAIELPAGSNPDALARTLCDHFVHVQDAWDSGDDAALAALTTPTMLQELRSQLCEYAGCGGRTEVLSLEATLLGYEQRDAVELVCVEFSGMLREPAQSGATPFRELWMLERSKQPSAAWKLARQQTLL